LGDSKYHFAEEIAMAKKEENRLNIDETGSDRYSIRVLVESLLPG
jgi:hypothetical protein